MAKNNFKKGKLVIFSGPSGVGKGTVLQQVLREKKFNLFYSVSMTTRKRRMGEIEGEQYYFVNETTFQQAISNNELLEYAKFIDNYYGTPIKPVQKLLSEGKNVLLEIEVQGSLQVMEKFKNYVSIFLMPPSIEILESRIRQRNTESHAMVKWRINKASLEMAMANKYQYVVLNDFVESAAQKVKKIFAKELLNQAETGDSFE